MQYVKCFLFMKKNQNFTNTTLLHRIICTTCAHLTHQRSSALEGLRVE